MIKSGSTLSGSDSGIKQAPFGKRFPKGVFLYFLQVFDQLVPDAVRHRDLPVTAGFTLALLLFGAVPLLRRRPASLRRWQGALLLSGYVAYAVWILCDETGAA